MPEKVAGDCNWDGLVSISDVIMLQKWLIGSGEITAPENADANGAYNIARKALWCIDQIKAAEDDKLDKVKLAISNKEWLEYAQKG